MTDFPNIDKRAKISLDYETTGLDYWHQDFRVFGAAVSVGDASWYWDLRHTPGAIQWLRDLLPGREVIAQYAQFEIQCSRLLGIDPRSVDWYCTMTAECLIDEHRRTYDLFSICGYHGIDSQKRRHLDAIQAAMGLPSHGAVLAALDAAPTDLVTAYGSSDALDAFLVHSSQQAEIESQELHHVLRLERNLTPVLADMSWGGIRVNVEGAHAAIPQLDVQADILQTEVNQMSGGTLNVNSSPQIKAFFKPEALNKFQWRLIDGTIVGPTKKGGGPSLDAKAMLSIRHPIAAKILALRKTIKLRDTFLRGHIIGHADDDGYVHTSFNQSRTDQDAGVVTGRLSSTNPALQQITARDVENAAILRSLFLPDKGQEWMCADHSQIDFRCGAHLQNDPNVIQAYQENPNLDYHQIVSDMTGIPRNPPYAGAPYTKQINLGLSFGAGAGKLAFMMNMPFEVTERRNKMVYLPGPEASETFKLYHAKLPAVKKFMEHAERVAAATGYVKTATGRRLRFPNRMGTHKAAGLLYQAYAADIHKYGLVNTDAAIREEKLPARLMMSCHDEIGVSMEREERARQSIMREYTNFNSDESPIKMRVPITASSDYGPNWYEASK